MTDDQLSELLIRTLRERAPVAPDAAAIRARMRTATPARSRARWSSAPLLAAAAVVAVVGGVALARPALSGAPVPGVADASSPPSTADAARSGATASVTVYDATRPASWEGEPPWQLVRHQLKVTPTGNPAYDAVTALLEIPRDVAGRSSWFTMVKGRPAAHVNSVEVQSGAITVDIDRSLRDPYPQFDCQCPTGDALMQAIAWTAQDAARVELPVRLTVEDRPARWLAITRIPASTFPDPAYLQLEPKTGWYGQACGDLTIHATTSDGTVTESADASAVDRMRASLRVKVRVGQTVTLGFIGQCGDQVAVRLRRTDIVDQAADLSYLARRPGTVRLLLAQAFEANTAMTSSRPGGLFEVGRVELIVTGRP